jgi:hypothetical protein
MSFADDAANTISFLKKAFTSKESALEAAASVLDSFGVKPEEAAEAVVKVRHLKAVTAPTDAPPPEPSPDPATP